MEEILPVYVNLIVNIIFGRVCKKKKIPESVVIAIREPESIEDAKRSSEWNEWQEAIKME